MNILVKMSSKNQQKLVRKRVGEIPLLKAAEQKLGFREILSKYIKPHGNEIFPAVDTLLLLAFNLAGGRQPLYELEEWVLGLDPTPLGYQRFEEGVFNDDRFGRALDKLYDADRASMMTEIVLNTVQATQLNLDELHNDSTTLKAFGRIAGKTNDGLYLARGNSKDHRPDLKQLVYCLTISKDGAVPVHFKTYPGNRTDDTTHIETWTQLSKIAGRTDFLYVADCKLCTDKQLHHIVHRGGRVVTIMPDNWTEAQSFKEALRMSKKRRTVVLRRPVPNDPDRVEAFSCFHGNHVTTKRGYRIYWIYSTEKKKRDRSSREARLQKAELALNNLMGKINTRQLKTREQILQRAYQILEQYKARNLYHINILEVQEFDMKQVGKGRPGKNTRYEPQYKTIYSLSWARNKKAIGGEENLDGIFPILCTDENLTAKDALAAYKYQPNLEKRFYLFKQILLAAPLLFKKIERVESIMFVLFLALIFQAFIEREIRRGMKRAKIEAIPIYPEHRLSYHPTTAKVFDRFENVYTHLLIRDDGVVDEYRDTLTDIQTEILALLGIPEDSYWQS